jgi:molybdate transport system ATP-binding protein
MEQFRPMVDAKLVKQLPRTDGSGEFRLDIHLQLSAGITALFGPSGSGKTLTLNCLAGFARPDSGRILIDGQLFYDGATDLNLAARFRRCGYIFQDHALFPHMTVRENLHFAAASAFGARLRGLNRNRRINELLQSFELTDLASRKPAQLSGGQKQRAALARILVGEPRVLLLDEPTRGLDTRLRSAFYGVLRSTVSRLQIPALLVTHDFEESCAAADYLCLLNAGQIEQFGPKNDVLERPTTTEIARRLGIYIVLPASIEALDPARNTSRLRIYDSHVNGKYLPGHLLGDSGYLCVRESEIRVSEPTSIRGNHVILDVTGYGMSSRGILVMLQDGITITVSHERWKELYSSPKLSIEFPTSEINFLRR